MSITAEDGSLYRTIWRWHFYAALLVIPSVIMLSFTGSIYLFKPQLDRWQQSALVERSTSRMTPTGDVDPDVQLSKVMAAYPGRQFQYYRLPEKAGDPAIIRIADPATRAASDVLVAADGEVIGAIDKDAWWSELVSRLHGELLLGDFGSAIVELAANWAIVMVLSGLYLWWPRGRGLAGVLWPRLQQGRVLWRDLHAVTGFWVSGLVLVLLVSGLPWTGIWGDGFKWVRTEMGWNGRPQEWRTSHQQDHDHRHLSTGDGGPATAGPAVGIVGTSLRPWVEQADRLGLAHPVIITPPGGPKRFGQGRESVWTIRSDSQDRTERTTVYFDLKTGLESRRAGFADQHVIDRVIGYGISWHEGKLFGMPNLVAGLLTAAGLVTLTISGTVMWLRRTRREVGLGAPPAGSGSHRLPHWLIGIAAVLLVALPLLTASIIAIALLERHVLSRSDAIAAWLGLRARRA